MIFKSKKAFEEKVYERMNEIDFRTKTDERLYKMEESLNELRRRINMIEDRLTVPQPQPYIVNPSWTGTDPVDHTPYTGAWGGNSMTGGDSPCTT